MQRVLKGSVELAQGLGADQTVHMQPRLVLKALHRRRDGVIERGPDLVLGEIAQLRQAAAQLQDPGTVRAVAQGVPGRDHGPRLLHRLGDRFRLGLQAIEPLRDHVIGRTGQCRDRLLHPVNRSRRSLLHDVRLCGFRRLRAPRRGGRSNCCNHHANELANMTTEHDQSPLNLIRVRHHPSMPR